MATDGAVYGLATRNSSVLSVLMVRSAEDGFLTIAFLVLFPSLPFSNAEFTEHFWV